MSIELPLTAWQRQRQRAHDEAQVRADLVVAENARWAAKAAETQAALKAERDREARGRAELVSHLLTPGAAEDMVMAQITMNAPVIAADRPLPSKFCWMPKGEHHLCCGNGFGGTWEGAVKCDEQAANAVIASFNELVKAGWRTFIDVEHREGESAAWVHGFSWDAAAGIMCSVEWTPLGEMSLRGRIFMSFSPSFLINNDSGRVAGLRTNAAAGALTNRPAFGRAMPPILATARTSLAAVTTDALRASGYSEASVKIVSDAIEAGRSTEAVALLITALR